METLQLWRPDTCGCIIHQAVDETTGAIRYVTRDEAVTIHQQRFAARPATTLNPNTDSQPAAMLCQAHASLGHTQARYSAVMGENVRKNISFSIATAIVSSLKPESYLWWFDANRVLQVSFPSVNLNQQQKNQIQSALDLQFGAGLVKVL